ncbi:MAG TPA: hypothetical protein VGR14_00625 [Verrucomicrobiae bacterium]|nr:hypothetical protein [Verrucomicrobiae bacterium]
MGDEQAGPLHHQRQRHDMGLTIHYQLASTGDDAKARKLVQQLRQTALDLPIQHVGEIVECRGDECSWKQRADDDPFRWLLIQAGTHIALPVSASEKRRGVRREMDVRPLHVIAFETEPGDGCEQANFGLCQYPSEVSHPEFGKHQTKLEGWSWHSFCKTHYASDPRCGGLPNFVRCHLGVVALLDEAHRLGILGAVSDEGDFWETRSLERLTKEIGQQSAILAGFLGVLKDAMSQAPGGADAVEAPIAAYPNFEHLEAEGQRLLPEQLKTMLKALARSSLLRGEPS